MFNDNGRVGFPRMTHQLTKIVALLVGLTLGFIVGFGMGRFGWTPRGPEERGPT